MCNRRITLPIMKSHCLTKSLAVADSRWLGAGAKKIKKGTSCMQWGAVAQKIVIC